MKLPIKHVRQFLLLGIIFSCIPTTAIVALENSPDAPKSTKPDSRWTAKYRACEISTDAKEHPEINFVFAKDGKPADTQIASVDLRVPSSGKLVLWLMGHNEELFQRITGYGHHAIQIHYANGWFSKLNKEPPPNDLYLGNIRLEAATGEDFSEAIQVPYPDSIVGRTTAFIQWLATKHPEGKWEQYLDGAGQVLWDRVIVAGISHGSTTAARFAMHQKVNRVVMFSGPRDQFENWYALPSATPKDRFYAFTHELDTGWERGHYPRSWKILNLAAFGPIVNVDQYLGERNEGTALEKSSEPKFLGSHQLITSVDVGGDADRAHSASIPGRAAAKDQAGNYVHESVWRYLFVE